MTRWTLLPFVNCFSPHYTNTIIGTLLSTTSMLTKLHYTLLHSLPSILALPRTGAHPQVRAPPPSSSSTMITRKHHASMMTMRARPIFLLLAVFLNIAVSLSESDAEVLLKFKKSLKNTGKLSNWVVSVSPCNGWNGILCDNGRVWGLQLENMGLKGVIDVETLTKLQGLRTVSFMGNDFDGSLPDWTRLGALKSIFLSNNKFSGDIPPSAFSGMMMLKKLHLANNKFSGPIPTTWTGLPRLLELSLENNEFEGEIPNFEQDGLKVFNVSNNKLVGEIPAPLSHLNASSFSGNKDLCGEPLKACPTSNSTDGHHDHHRPAKGVSMATIVAIAIVGGAVLIALVVFTVFCICRKKKPQSPQAAAASAATSDLNRTERGQAAVTAARAASPEHGKQGGVKLTFLKEDVERFEMQDLLKASAEVLGSGIIGSSYKAALNSGRRVVVVKRCKHMNTASKEDFNEHMRRLGRLNHPNVLPIVAFYYRKEEKLLVSQYAKNLSLAIRLHGNRSRDNPSLDWAIRLNIVKGVAKGLLYLHNELPSLTVAHGHLKSSNVLLDSSYKPLLADYGLIPIVNKEHAEKHLVSYKSPEYKDSRSLTKKTDVWSLGMLILEILTGKDQAEKGTDDTPVFDKEMARDTHSHGEMMKLYNIGLSCCNEDVHRRPEIKEVVDKIEDIKEKENGSHSS